MSKQTTIMAQEVTVGGDRLGSGKKITQELHNYGMNSFNQERDWKSSMAPGILYPCFKEIGTNHGTFDIDVDAFVRTLPTKGPLFGSFKLQVDFFQVPFRLYQGILHNNPVDIGLNMNQVYLPKMVLAYIDENPNKVIGNDWYHQQVNSSALLKYLGISGIGKTGRNQIIHRKIQCIPLLGYYDIFKNYYSNKQEENAYVITPGDPTQTPVFNRIIQGGQQTIAEYTNYEYDEDTFTVEKNNANTQIFRLFVKKATDIINKEDYLSNILIETAETNESIETLTTNGIFRLLDLQDGDELEGATYPGMIYIALQIPNWQNFIDWAQNTTESTDTSTEIYFSQQYETHYYTSDIQLTPFALKNIDKMRAKLLSCNELGDEFTIENDSENSTTWGDDSGEDQTGLPYISVVKRFNETGEPGNSWNEFTQNGLVVKTYQSDLFNNWLESSFIDTISNRTKIDTTNGGFTPDTLILQEKIYQLLNRILVSGGTYYDWQEAVYGEGAAKMCEIPLYIGGMSAEIMFEEVISSSDTVSQQAGYQPLGSLGGKGTIAGKKGGNNIHVRMDEPGYVMAMVSITPRIAYNQGNDWDMTDLNTLDDLHKPELDQIGFQDMMIEQLAWWNTRPLNAQSQVLGRQSYGKQIAWINYQTAIDRSYGDFDKTDGYAFMVLNRNYEHSENNANDVKDITTYIDPAKYNYAFAVTDLSAQNFWVQLHFKCISRRKMGAQQLPNL